MQEALVHAEPARQLDGEPEQPGRVRYPYGASSFWTEPPTASIPERAHRAPSRSKSHRKVVIWLIETGGIVHSSCEMIWPCAVPGGTVRVVIQTRTTHAGVREAHRLREARADRRWLLAWAAMFAAALGFLLAAHQVYRITGPHPEINTFIRRMKHQARWLIPGVKGRPNAG